MHEPHKESLVLAVRRLRPALARAFSELRSGRGALADMESACEALEQALQRQTDELKALRELLGSGSP
jgi:hypothetical protein